MKKIIALCLCLLTVCFSFAACNGSGNISVPMGFQLASDPEIVDYLLFVPEKWTVDMSTGTTYAYYSTYDPTSISASLMPLESVEGGIDAYFESYTKQFTDVFGEPENIETANLLLDGKEAKQYVYSTTFGDVEYKFWQVVCIHQQRVYTITFSSTAENYESHVTDMEAALEHFAFVE